MKTAVASFNQLNHSDYQTQTGENLIEEQSECNSPLQLEQKIKTVKALKVL